MVHNLPQGFVLDEAQTGLPEGFAIDTPGLDPNSPAAFTQRIAERQADPRTNQQILAEQQQAGEERERQFARDNPLGTQLVEAFVDPRLDIGLDTQNERALATFIEDNIQNPFGRAIVGGIARVGGELGAGLLDIVSTGISGAAGEVAASARREGFITSDAEFEDAKTDLDLFGNIALLLSGSRPGAVTTRQLSARELRGKVPPTAPTGLSLKRRGGAILEQAEKSPIRVSAPRIDNLIQNAKSAIPSALEDSRSAINNHIARLRPLFDAGKPITMVQMLKVRRDLSRALNASKDPNVRFDLIPLLGEFDSFVVRPSNIVGPAQSTARFLAQFEARLAEGRTIYARAMKTMDLEEAIAAGLSGTTPSQVAIPANFKTLVDIENSSRIRGFRPRFSDAETALMADISGGGNWFSRLMNTIGKFGKLSLAAGQVFNPKVGIGIAGRVASGSSALGQAQTARSLVASGIPLAATVQRAPRQGLIGALVGAQGIPR